MSGRYEQVDKEEDEEDIKDNPNHEIIDRTSKYMLKNEKIKMNQESMNRREREILSVNAKGWPKVFESNFSKCPNCNSTNISKSQNHIGVEQTYIFTVKSYEAKSVFLKKCHD